MKRTIYLFLFFLAAVCSVKAEPVRIMGIGNSFTVDALEQHFQPLLTAEGVDAIIGYPYRGGTELSQHDAWTNRTDTMPYNYRKFKDGKYSTTGLATYSLKMALEDEPWDYVLIQSDHDSVGVYKSYVPYMEHLIAFVHEHCSNPDVKIGFYMTWAYDATSTYSGFKIYNRDQQLMYDSVIACAQKVMADHPELELLIPAGTAVQNARTSFMGERMNRDGYHLHYEHGRYVASLSWYETIFGKNVQEVTWKPETLTDYCANMCRTAVHEAILHPFEVTDLSEEYGEPDQETIEPGTESHLRRVTVNGMNIPFGDEETELVALVDWTRKPVTLYARPMDNNAELNITDAWGSDIEKDPSNPWYYPLTAPDKSETVSYTIRVISEAMGEDETVYTLTLTGADASELVYPIASREDMEDFAWAVNSGSYAINGELTADINMNHTKQDCWMNPIGSVDHPFTGTFDGKGHVISGFNIYSVDNDLLKLKYVGLFGYIKNVVIKEVHITGTEESYFNRPSSGTDETGNCAYGILCGCIESSTIQDCSVSCPIFTNVSGQVAMIVGRNADVSGAPASTVERCSAEGTWRIRHKGIYGGIMGYGYNCLIKDCYCNCTMALQQDKGARIGGILGYGKTSSSRTITIQNCHAYGKITPFENATNTAYLGAIAGVFNGTSVKATNCWYLNSMADKAFGQQDNSEKATAATKEQFADGTVLAALGEAWEQGGKYPELLALEHVNPEGIESIQPSAVSHQKRLCNGQLLIEHDGMIFNAQGARVY